MLSRNQLQLSLRKTFAKSTKQGLEPLANHRQRYSCCLSFTSNAIILIVDDASNRKVYSFCRCETLRRLSLTELQLTLILRRSHLIVI